jgi:hypothetical protein
MLHACLHQLLYVLFTLHGIFMHFLELTYDGAVLTDQLGTPRGRCDEHISKFSLSYETKV